MRVGQLEGVIIASDLMRYSYFLTGSGLEQAALPSCAHEF